MGYKKEGSHVLGRLACQLSFCWAALRKIFCALYGRFKTSIRRPRAESLLWGRPRALQQCPPALGWSQPAHRFLAFYRFDRLSRMHSIWQLSDVVLPCFDPRSGVVAIDLLQLKGITALWTKSALPFIRLALLVGRERVSFRIIYFWKAFVSILL